jgi:hypothetical protein
MPTDIVNAALQYSRVVTLPLSPRPPSSASFRVAQMHTVRDSAQVWTALCLLLDWNTKVC